MQKHRPKQGGYDRGSSGPSYPTQEFRKPRPVPVEAPKALASALRVKNFRNLRDAVGEEALAIALELNLSRVKELAEGINFTTETTHHIETVLNLKSGFMDQVNPVLSEVDVARLRQPRQDEPVHEEVVAAPVAQQARTAPTQSHVEEVTVAKASKVSPVQQQTEAIPVTEESLREVRRLNLITLTARQGAKTLLGRLTGLSAANVSHRLHGNKIFDRETADFFCERLGLPLGWFEVEHSEADIPAETLALLSGTGAAPAAAPAPKKAAAPPPAKVAAVKLAPTAASVGLSAAARGQATGAPATAAPAPAQPAARKTPEPAPVVAPALAAAVTASAAPASKPASVAHTAMLRGADDVGPIAEALIRTLALMARDGRLGEERALEMLVEVAHR